MLSFHNFLLSIILYIATALALRKYSNHPEKGEAMSGSHSLFQLIFDVLAAIISFLVLIKFVTFILHSGYGSSTWSQWVNLGDNHSPEALLWYYYMRWFQLIETYILLFSNRTISSFHLFHHSSMLFTSWIFMNTKFHLVWIIAVLNCVDNGLFYLSNSLRDAKMKEWRRPVTSLLQLWTDIETAVGYGMSPGYLFACYMTDFSCKGIRDFVLVGVIHALVGYMLGTVRKEDEIVSVLSVTFAVVGAAIVIVWAWCFGFFGFIPSPSLVLVCGVGCGLCSGLVAWLFNCSDESRAKRR
jgi:hypothetical protein